MDSPELRPRLMTFRVLTFNTKNELSSTAPGEVLFEMRPEIELGLVKPSQPDGIFEAIATIRMTGRATLKETPDALLAEFSGAYEARFMYPQGTTEAELSPRFEREPHQYMLVAQAFPLASSHFRRELMAMGFSVGNMPLGI